MSKMRFRSTRSGFFSGKGFYVALSLCLLAVGAASYIAIMSITDLPDNLTNLPSETTSSAQSTAQVGQTVSGITGSRPAASGSSEAASSAASSKAPAVQSKAPPVATFFVMPVSGEIIKPFSDTELQYSETYKDWRLHAAIDIAAQKNAPVKAVGDGVVLDIVTDPLLGVTLSIDHGNQIISYYSGLAKTPPVKKGDAVEVGKVIGYVDVVPCEMLDPIHLHFMITQNGDPVSPTKLMSIME